MASAASETIPAEGEQQREPLAREPPCYDQHLRRVHPEAADTIADAIARRLGVDADSDQAGEGQAEWKKKRTEPEWLTVTQAASVSGCSRGEISRAADNGSLKSNGEKGRERRIDAAHLALWQLRRAERKEAVESDTTVENKFKGTDRK
jgi:hypothetical protein